MRILITGSGGLIGGFLTQAFLAEGHEVLAAYRHTPPRIEGVSNRLRLIRVDLAKAAGGLESAEGLKPVDVIVHAAAHTHLIPNSTASDYVRSNVLGTLNLIDYAKAVQPKLFVYLSTLSVYGAVTVSPLDEHTPLNQPELYGATKYVGELSLREAAETIPSVCVRLPGVVGPGSSAPWISGVLRAALHNQPIRIYNPEAPFNNVVDLEDLNRFIAHLIQRDWSGSDWVNLAAAEPIRIREVVELVRSLTGSDSPIAEDADPAGKASFWIRLDKLRRVFRFEPSPTRSIIRRYVMGSRPDLATKPVSTQPATEGVMP